MIRELCPSLRQWMRDDAPAGPLWRLGLSGPDGTSLEVDSSDARPEARVSVGATTDNRGFHHLSLRADLQPGWTVTHLDFPVISDIDTRVARTAAVPTCWGLEYDLEPGMSYEGVYPSCVAAMQFVVLCGSEEALYIGQHDRHGGHKEFRIRAGDGNASFESTCRPAVDESAGGVFELPYDVVIGTVEGGYYEAARVYRKFTYQADWGKAGPVSGRSIPKWLMDTDLWLRIKPELCPQTEPEVFRRAAEFFGVPTAVHWYRWHQIPYDTLYPEYFPAREGFVECIRELQAAGMRVMPYINGRLCDPESTTWNDEGGSEWAARDESGGPYTEVYGSKVPLNAMCPSTRFWQDKIAELVDRLANECGVDGVYIDQIGCAQALRCFAPSHDHSPGGGTFWVEGYRDLLDAARRTLPEDAILTTEENAECWIDQLDALLMVNTPTPPGARPIPLFPAVYAGRTITFGFRYLVADDMKQGLPFRHKMAHAFVYGAQLGWVAAGWIMAPEAAREAEFLRNLARCRRFAHDFVVTGDFLGMIDVGGDNPRMACEAGGAFGGTYRIDTPAVIASAWLAEDGRLGVLLANMSDEAREVEVDPPLGKAGLDAAGGYALETYGPEGLVSVERSASAVLKIRATDRGALLLSLSPLP